MEQLKKYKKWFFALECVCLFLFFRGIFFVDKNWWWMMIVILPLLSMWLHLSKEEMENDTHLRNRVRYALGWSTLFSFVFVLCAAFITAWWLFGLLITVWLDVLWVGVAGETFENPLPKKEKRYVLLTAGAIFVLMFCLFCIPSYVANNHKNPKDQFPSEREAVTSYYLYGSNGLHDREHVIPQSWYVHEDHYVNDYVNVIWSNQIANNRRGNWEFGNVKKTTDNTVYSDDVVVGYKDDKHFMPTDEFKGDVARIVLYMYVTYMDDGLSRDNINLNLMKKWSNQDPVDAREKIRNDLIMSTYGYSNRFVESPILVGFIH